MSFPFSCAAGFSVSLWVLFAAFPPSSNAGRACLPTPDGHPAGRIDEKLYSGMRLEAGSVRSAVGRALSPSKVCRANPTHIILGPLRVASGRRSMAAPTGRPLFDKEDNLSIGAIAVAPFPITCDLWSERAKRLIPRQPPPTENGRFIKSIECRPDLGKTSDLKRHQARSGALIVHPHDPDIAAGGRPLGHAFGLTRNEEFFGPVDGRQDLDQGSLSKDETPEALNVRLRSTQPKHRNLRRSGKLGGNRGFFFPAAEPGSGPLSLRRQWRQLGNGSKGMDCPTEYSAVIGVIRFRR